MKRVRCAIYTRKSSEEGLEQDFNSLDAQHAACSAYVLSQASEGWVEIDRRYDDGGISGGTLERPAIQQLLHDVHSGLIDIVVVYKVDRLTRSLLDFAKLVEAFDQAGTSFVSVTQSFNTTTSMGRLTLNMLLSFAQFEREVTAERIRDKLAASKARGMWMGGTPPIGYRPDGRSLAIVPEEAELVRTIFELYQKLGAIRLLEIELQRRGFAKPVRTTLAGRSFGGSPFGRGELHAILANPIYVGRIRHRTKTYPGLHQPIIDESVGDAVQDLLAGNRIGPKRRKRAASHPSLLAGKLCDVSTGEPMVASHASKGSRRYRYYIARSLNRGERHDAHDAMRIPAGEIEQLVILELSRLLRDPERLIAAITNDATEATAAARPELITRAIAFADHVGSSTDQAKAAMLAKLIAKVESLHRPSPSHWTARTWLPRSVSHRPKIQTHFASISPSALSDPAWPCVSSFPMTLSSSRASTRA
jgi:site-specific DNA recombinase